MAWGQINEFYLTDVWRVPTNEEDDFIQEESSPAGGRAWCFDQVNSGLGYRPSPCLQPSILMNPCWRWESEATLKHATVLHMVAKSGAATVKPALLIGPKLVVWQIIICRELLLEDGSKIRWRRERCAGAVGCFSSWERGWKVTCLDVDTGNFDFILIQLAWLPFSTCQCHRYYIRPEW